MYQESIYNWIKKISSAENGPICPYSMKAWLNNEVRIEEDYSKIEDLIPMNDNISVCIVPMPNIKYEDLSNICDSYNEQFSDYLFLDTHPEEKLTLRGIKTVWEFPAVIIQRKSELLEARSHLMKIGFYKNWDKPLLDSLGID